LKKILIDRVAVLLHAPFCVSFDERVRVLQFELVKNKIKNENVLFFLFLNSIVFKAT